MRESKRLALLRAESVAKPKKAKAKKRKDYRFGRVAVGSFEERLLQAGIGLKKNQYLALMGVLRLCCFSAYIPGWSNLRCFFLSRLSISFYLWVLSSQS